MIIVGRYVASPQRPQRQSPLALLVQASLRVLWGQSMTAYDV
jgi:hypothetical protein